MSSVEMIIILIAVVAMGVVLAGLMLVQQRAFRAERIAWCLESAVRRREFNKRFTSLDPQLVEPLERTAYQAGLLDGLCIAFTIQRGAA